MRPFFLFVQPDLLGSTPEESYEKLRSIMEECVDVLRREGFASLDALVRVLSDIVGQSRAFHGRDPASSPPIMGETSVDPLGALREAAKVAEQREAEARLAVARTVRHYAAMGWGLPEHSDGEPDTEAKVDEIVRSAALALDVDLAESVVRLAYVLVHTPGLKGGARRARAEELRPPLGMEGGSIAFGNTYQTLYTSFWRHFSDEWIKKNDDDYRRAVLRKSAELGFEEERLAAMDPDADHSEDIKAELGARLASGRPHA